MLFNQIWARMSTGEAIHGLHGKWSTEREHMPCSACLVIRNAKLVECVELYWWTVGTIFGTIQSTLFWELTQPFFSSSHWLLSQAPKKNSHMAVGVSLSSLSLNACVFDLAPTRMPAGFLFNIHKLTTSFVKAYL